MFSLAAVQERVDQLVKVPHTVKVLDQFSFQIRPNDFQEGNPGYSVIVDRHAFRMRALVKFDPFGYRIRQSILAGVTSKPAAEEDLAKRLRTFGWNPDVRISDDELLVGATQGDDPALDLHDDPSSCFEIAAALSDFILNQLIITEPFNTRIARPRELNNLEEEADVWQYDPAERDRSTRRHRCLENWLIEQLLEEGLKPRDAVGDPMFDLCWNVGDELVICEVKSSVVSESKQIRLGVGQVLHYRAQTERALGTSVRAALLIEQPPDDSVWLDIARKIDLVLFWPQEGSLPHRLLR